MSTSIHSIMIAMGLVKKSAALSETNRLYMNLPLDIDVLPKDYPTNKSRTSKYTAITFLPLNFYEQMQRVANVFFLLIAIMQRFPMFAVDGISWIKFVPITLILGATALKDGYEDHLRGQDDKRQNESVCFVNRDNKNPQFPNDPCVKIEQKKWTKQEPGLDIPGTFNGWKKTMWQHLRPGDLVLLLANEAVPADIVLLSTGMAAGIAFVSTKGLDGETNLKRKEAVVLTQDVDSPSNCTKFSISIEHERPNPNLYSYKGNLTIYELNSSKVESIIPISSSNVLLAGSFVKNTNWVVGFITGVGPESKVVLNSKKGARKTSQVEKTLNLMVKYCNIMPGFIKLCYSIYSVHNCGVSTTQ